MRVSSRLLLCSALGALTASACGSSKRTIRIPDSVVPNPKARSKTPPANIRPYVIKMSDGQRTWQIEIPATEATGAFQAVVPLALGESVVAGGAGSETEADREIRAASPAPEPEPPAEPGATKPAPRSYLGTLARVSELYKRRQHELALIELVSLERQFPDDERILEMKGTLYWKLKKTKLAREAWERVLALNPNNASVAQALENLIAE